MYQVAWKHVSYRFSDLKLLMAKATPRGVLCLFGNGVLIKTARGGNIKPVQHSLFRSESDPAARANPLDNTSKRQRARKR
jgi:hypothetical protein